MLLIAANDIISELLTPDKNAFIALAIGFVGGLLGTFLRNQLATAARKRREGIKLYIGWSIFGALCALTLNPFPFFSLALGVCAPLTYKIMEELLPGIIDLAGKLKPKKD